MDKIGQYYNISQWYYNIYPWYYMDEVGDIDDIIIFVCGIIISVYGRDNIYPWYYMEEIEQYRQCRQCKNMFCGIDIYILKVSCPKCF